MEQTPYIQITGDWYLGTDGMSFTLLKRRVVQDNPRAKKENVGQERYETMGYYATLGGVAGGLHRYLSLDVLNSGAVTTLDEFVAELKERIAGVKRLDEELVRQLARQMGVHDE